MKQHEKALGDCCKQLTAGAEYVPNVLSVAKYKEMIIKLVHKLRAFIQMVLTDEPLKTWGKYIFFYIFLLINSAQGVCETKLD